MNHAPEPDRPRDPNAGKADDPPARGSATDSASSRGGAADTAAAPASGGADTGAAPGAPPGRPAEPPAPRPSAYDPMAHDPIGRLQHAFVGMALALLGSVFIAAALGSALGRLFHDTYEVRVALYGALLLYVVAGAVVLFVKVARHETQRVSAARVLRWLLSLWLWPLLLVLQRRAR